MRLFIVLTNIATAIFAATLWLAPALAQTEPPPAVMFDGYATKYEYGQITTAEFVSPPSAFMVQPPDRWHTGGRIDLNGLPTYRTDLSMYNHVSVMLKANRPMTVSLIVGKYGGVSSPKEFTVGTEWDVYRVLLADMVSDTFNWKSCDYLRFIIKDWQLGDYVLVDNVYLHTGQIPLPEPPPVEPPVEPPPLPPPPPIEPPVLTWGEWHIDNAEATIVFERVAADGTTQIQVVPITLSIGVPVVGEPVPPEVQP